MSYLDILKSEAETRLKALSLEVAKVSRELASLHNRAEAEAGNVEKLETNLAGLKAAAGKYLTQNEFASFRVRLKRVTADLAASKEAVTMFARELIPGKERELTDARKKLTDEFSILYAAAKPACEAEMARLLEAVIAERDAFVAVFAEIGRTYGGSYNGGAPVAYHVRLDEIKHTLTGRRWLTFKAAPPISAAPVAPAPPVEAVVTPEKADTPATLPAVPVLARPACVETPPTPSLGESVKGDTPRGETLAPEAIDAPAEDSPAPTENPPETPPVDLAPDTPAPDVDAEAPPVDGEKENPKIAAEGS